MTLEEYEERLLDYSELPLPDYTQLDTEEKFNSALEEFLKDYDSVFPVQQAEQELSRLEDIRVLDWVLLCYTTVLLCRSRPRWRTCCLTWWSRLTTTWTTCPTTSTTTTGRRAATALTTGSEPCCSALCSTGHTQNSLGAGVCPPAHHRTKVISENCLNMIK